MDYNILYYSAGISIGGSAGYLYYKHVGCRTGACPLTSNPFSSALFGAILGYLLTGNFIH